MVEESIMPPLGVPHVFEIKDEETCTMMYSGKKKRRME